NWIIGLAAVMRYNVVIGSTVLRLVLLNVMGFRDIQKTSRASATEAQVTGAWEPLYLGASSVSHVQGLLSTNSEKSLYVPFLCSFH
ncbi:hypothetical protein GOODEAATRI_025657, partial [Goodea atripinnis]